jgi:glutathione S-transferase
MGGPDPSKFRMLGPGHPENGGELRRRWPFGQFPLLVGGDRSGTSAGWVVSFQGQPSAS